MLYGHLRNHTPFVAGCLLWIRTSGTWQKGHSLPPLPVVLLEPADCWVPVHLPPIASAAAGPPEAATSCGGELQRRQPPTAANSSGRDLQRRRPPVGPPAVAGAPAIVAAATLGWAARASCGGRGSVDGGGGGPRVGRGWGTLGQVSGVAEVNGRRGGVSGVAGSASIRI